MRPLSLIVLHHSASRAGDHSWEDIRKWHILPKSKGGKHGFDDIGYHYGIVDDGDGWAVKIGRPLEIAGAHAKGFNANSIGICFEGNFDKHRMPQGQVEVGIQLIARLVAKHGIALEAIKGHRDLPYATACPGKFFPMHQIRGGVRDIIINDWAV